MWISTDGGKTKSKAATPSRKNKLNNEGSLSTTSVNVATASEMTGPGSGGDTHQAESGQETSAQQISEKNEKKTFVI